MTMKQLDNDDADYFYLINKRPNSPRPLLHTVLVSQKYHHEIFAYRC